MRDFLLARRLVEAGVAAVLSKPLDPVERVASGAHREMVAYARLPPG